MAATAFDQIRRYGRSSGSVTIHLLGVIRHVAGCVTRGQDRVALMQQAAFIMLDSREAAFGKADRTLVAESHRAALAALQRVPA
jgi:uncharacterized membrane protein